MSIPTPDIKLSLVEVENALCFRQPESHVTAADTSSFETTSRDDQNRSFQLTATEAVSYSQDPLSGSFNGLSLTLPAQDTHRTKSGIVWEGKRITDDLAKTILIKELKPRDEASTIGTSEEYYFAKALQYMIMVIAYADRKWCWLEEDAVKNPSKQCILSTVPTADGMTSDTEAELVGNFQMACVDSVDNSVYHFSTLEKNVTGLLLKYVFRHIKPVVVWKYDENALQKEKENDENDEEDENEDEDDVEPR